MVSALSYRSMSLASCPAHVHCILSFGKTVHPQFLLLTRKRSTSNYPKQRLVITEAQAPPPPPPTQGNKWVAEMC